MTESHRFEQQLRLQAEQDGLTGLPTAAACCKPHRPRWPLAARLVDVHDLDHFKLINDTLATPLATRCCARWGCA